MARIGAALSRAIASRLAPLALVVIPEVAWAGNEEGILIGNEAAMTGGAVTATSSTGASMWYNPAALLNQNDRQLDVGGTGFQMRLYGTGGPLALTDGTQAEQTVQDRAFVPNAVAFSVPIGTEGLPQRIGLGVFATRHDTSMVQSALAYSGDTTELTATSVSHTRERQHHIPIAYAIRPFEQLTLGLTTQLVVHQVRYTYDYSLQEEPKSGGALSSFEEESVALNEIGIGIRASFGVQWRPIDALSFGASLLTPSRILLTSRTATTDASKLEADGVHGASQTETGWNTLFERFDTLRLRLATAYLFKRGWVSVEMDYVPGRDNEYEGRERGSVSNFRVGAMVKVSQALTVGAGAFSDREAVKGPFAPGEQRVDFYGGTLGLRYASDELLAGSLKYGITLAPRYAYGEGQEGVVEIDPTPPASSVGIVPTRAIVHEVGVHIGLDLTW